MARRSVRCFRNRERRRRGGRLGAVPRTGDRHPSPPPKRTRRPRAIRAQHRMDRAAVPARPVESRIEASQCDRRCTGHGPWRRREVEPSSEHATQRRRPVARSIHLHPSGPGRSGVEAMVPGDRDSNARDRLGDRRRKRFRRPRQSTNPTGPARTTPSRGVGDPDHGGPPSEGCPDSIVRVDSMDGRAGVDHALLAACGFHPRPGFEALAASTGSLPNAPVRSDPGSMPRGDRLRRLADRTSRASERRRDPRPSHRRSID